MPRSTSAASSGGPTDGGASLRWSPSSSACIESTAAEMTLPSCSATTSVVPKVRPSCSFVTRYRIGLAVSPSRGNRMWSDFTDLVGRCLGGGGEDLGEDLPAEDPVVADVEVLALDDAGLDLGQVEAGDERVLVEGHQVEPREEQGAGDRAAAVGDGRDLDVLRDLALAGLAAQLEDGLVDEPEAVEPAGRQLAAVGVERQLALAGDAVAALDERAALALAAEAERLEPRHGEEAEAVVELGDVDVAGLEVGALPEVGAGVAGGHRRGVVELVPRRPAPERRADRLEASDRVVDVGGVLGGRHDHGGGAVDRRVAVEEAERRGDHARRVVVVERHRVAVHGLRVDARRCGGR